MESTEIEIIGADKSMVALNPVKFSSSDHSNPALQPGKSVKKTPSMLR